MRSGDGSVGTGSLSSVLSEPVRLLALEAVNFERVERGVEEDSFSLGVSSGGSVLHLYWLSCDRANSPSRVELEGGTY